MQRKGHIHDYRVFSRHTRDLQVLLFIWLAVLLVGIAILVGFPFCLKFFPETNRPDALKVFIPVAGVLTAAIVTITQQLWATANRRLGTVDLFRSEIAGVVCAIWAYEIVPALEGLDFDHSGKALRVAEAMNQRSENYFEIFQKCIPELAQLPSPVVMSVTAFYTHLKASRDAILALKTWREHTSAEEMRQHVVVILRQLLFCLEAAQEALNAFSEPPESKRVRQAMSMVKGLRRDCKRALGDSAFPISTARSSQ